MGEPQDIVEHFCRVLALEGDVVDGKDGADVLIQRQRLVELAQEHRRHGGMPIVAVQDVAGEALG